MRAIGKTGYTARCAPLREAERRQLELYRSAPKAPARLLSREELARFAFSLRPASGFVRVARLHKPGASSLTVWQPVERGGLSAGKAVVTLGHHASTALDAVPARGAAMVVEARAPLVPLATRPAGLLAERSRNRPIGARHAHRVHLPRRRERPAAGVARARCRRCPEPSTNLLGTLLQAALDQVLARTEALWSRAAQSGRQDLWMRGYAPR